MQTGHYTFGSSRLQYYCWGTGPKLLFCFHGYGESAGSFAFLGEAVSSGSEYTLIAIDLPFHGQTDWKEGSFFDPRDLLDMLISLSASPDDQEDREAREHRDAHDHRNGYAPQWTLLGYSMGGRVALHLLQLAPERISRLVLLAPDGLQMNPWYWLATQNRPGNRLFRFTMDHPDWFFFLLRTGNALHCVNPGIYKFTIRYIDDVKVRQDLYTRWTTMRGFRPRLDVLRNIIRSRDIPIRLLYGRFDRIIRKERGELFCRGIESQCRLQVLPTGHQLLQRENLDIILTAITS